MAIFAFLGISGLLTGSVQDAFKKLVPLDPFLCKLGEWWENDPAPGSHFTILLGDLHHDVEGQHTDRVRRALEGQTGFHVKGTCKVLTIEPHKLQRDALDYAVESGQQMLTDNNADLLIWGEADHEYKELRLRFLSRENNSPIGFMSYELKRTELPFEFHTDFNAQLVATAATSIEPATREFGRYLVPILEPVAKKLENLQRHFPPDFTAPQRRLIHLSLGFAALELAEQIETVNWGSTAVDAFRAALAEFHAGHDPMLLVYAQLGLGDALMAVGNREAANQHLEDAIGSLTAAAEVLQQNGMQSTRTSALVQLDLGRALVLLGERAHDSNRLRDACAAYGEALRILKRGRTDLVWQAVARAGHANVLDSLAQFGNGNSQLTTKVLYEYRDALRILGRENVPLIRSNIQTELAGFLIRQARQQESSEHLEEAKILLEEVDKISPRSKLSYYWAITQLHWGNLFAARGSLESSIESLKIEWWEKAVHAYGDAIDVFKQGMATLHLAVTMTNQGSALRSIGQLERDSGKVHEAVSILKSASAILDPSHVPIHWANAQINLGLAYVALGDLESIAGPLQQSMGLFETARKILQVTDAKPSIAVVERNLHAAQMAHEIRTLEDAVTVAKRSVKIPGPEQEAVDQAKAKRQLADAFFRLGEALISYGDADRGKTLLEDAVSSYQQALTELNEEATPLAWVETTHRVADALTNLGITLSFSGQRDLGARRLTEAVDAYRKALPKLSQKAKAPAWVEWSLGPAGSFYIQTYRLSFGVPMKYRTQASVDLTTATARGNLGDALFFSGRMTQAVDAYRETLAERAYQKKTLQWAFIQNNLSIAEEAVASTKRDGRRKMCRALKDRVEVLSYLTSSKEQFLAKEVLTGIASVVGDQMLALNALPRTEARIVRKCLRELIPQLRKNRTKLNELQHANNLLSAKPNVEILKPDELCGS